MMGSITSYVKFAQGVIAQSAASGATTGRIINCQGFDRACHVFDLGILPSTGSARWSVWESATSGGTYTVISGTLISTIASIGGTAAYCVDVPVNVAKPYQKSLTTLATPAGFGSVVVLYSGSRLLPPSQEKTATVV